MTTEIVGSWTLVELLGRGSLGNVWRGQDQGGNVAAIKRISLVGWSGVTAELKRCSRVLCEHPHPGIVPIREVLRDGEGLAVVSDLVPGLSLDKELGAGKEFSGSEVISMMTQVALSLAALHANGLCHGDVKPGNIISGPRGTMLLDATLATVLARPDRWGPEVLGTVGFLDPAVIADGVLRPSSDVYSMGVCVYEAISGKHPFGGRSMRDVLNAAKRGAFEPLSKAAAGVSAELAFLVESCLERSPANRPSAAEVAQSLNLDGPFVAGAHAGSEAIASSWAALPASAIGGGPRTLRRRSLAATSGARPQGKIGIAGRPQDARTQGHGRGAQIAQECEVAQMLPDGGTLSDKNQTPRFTLSRPWTKVKTRSGGLFVACVALAVLGATLWSIADPQVKKQLPTMAAKTRPLPMTSWEGGILSVTFRPHAQPSRYRLGRPGDQLLVGYWGCKRIATAALYRPSTGEVYYFSAWPSPGKRFDAVRAQRSGVISGRAQLTVRNGCDVVKIIS